MAGVAPDTVDHRTWAPAFAGEVKLVYPPLKSSC
jgi:hypothetical protein